ncbi:MAG: beta-N-acetylhexosaminidase [Deltaproteobacteria bacterium]|nr:beta-N-acetylhexosaminidase [Deltaproteobacteria bacterium]
MTLERSLGEHFIIGFPGKKPSKEFLAFLEEASIGGVILFAENIASPKQLRELTTELQDAVGRTLLIAIDHEGGRVFRCPKPFTHFPPMAEVSKAAQKEGKGLVFEIGKTMATELRASGVNWNLAPVLDVATNPFNPVIGDRSLSSNPQVVADLGCEFIRGLEAGGIMSCGKHFPGHGDTDLDSHLDLPQLPHTRKRFDACEFIPFRAAIAAGVPAIMTAHLRVPLLDPVNPATISTSILTGILRNELGFDGVIVSDDLEMKGIANLMPIPEAGLRSLVAGCDMVILRRDLTIQQQLVQLLHDAVDRGVIPKPQLDASYQRIARAKGRYL